jgi:hypothetical protein
MDMMVDFQVADNFPFGGIIMRAGDMLEVPESRVKAEMLHGVHKKTGKPISGLLNHCEPACNGAEALLEGFVWETVKKESDEDKAKKKEELDAQKKAEKDALQSEFDASGIACDRKWGIQKLKDELKKARKAGK